MNARELMRKAERAAANEGSFHRDELRELRTDFVLANPPFDIADWGGERLRENVRWAFGAPPVGDANFAWLQHILHELMSGGIRLKDAEKMVGAAR